MAGPGFDRGEVRGGTDQQHWQRTGFSTPTVTDDSHVLSESTLVENTDIVLGVTETILPRKQPRTPPGRAPTRGGLVGYRDSRSRA
ncbi:hypothetical protein D8S78_19395 [Natrialba swarupiae]|nr:hypothetical protein [Natrialba swarupiae]